MSNPHVAGSKQRCAAIDHSCACGCLGVIRTGTTYWDTWDDEGHTRFIRGHGGTNRDDRRRGNGRRHDVYNGGVRRVKQRRRYPSTKGAQSGKRCGNDRRHPENGPRHRCKAHNAGALRDANTKVSELKGRLSATERILASTDTMVREQSQQLTHAENTCQALERKLDNAVTASVKDTTNHLAEIEEWRLKFVSQRTLIKEMVSKLRLIERAEQLRDQRTSVRRFIGGKDHTTGRRRRSRRGAADRRGTVIKEPSQEAELRHIIDELEGLLWRS